MKKLAIITSLAGATTFSLFVFMAFLISSDKVAYIEAEPETIIDVANLPDETPAMEKPNIKLTPPMPPPEMPRTTITTETNEVNTDLSYTPATLTVTTDTLSGTSLGKRADSDARPIVRVNPKYPIVAARNGTEGWVMLAFDINAIGEVINIKIIDSQPKRVFDKAAKQALKKWKYRAKSVDGKLVEQHNFTVQLDFNMSQQS